MSLTPQTRNWSGTIFCHFLQQTGSSIYSLPLKPNPKKVHFSIRKSERNWRSKVRPTVLAKQLKAIKSEIKKNKQSLRDQESLGVTRFFLPRNASDPSSGAQIFFCEKSVVFCPVIIILSLHNEFKITLNLKSNKIILKSTDRAISNDSHQTVIGESKTSRMSGSY